MQGVLGESKEKKKDAAKHVQLVKGMPGINARLSFGVVGSLRISQTGSSGL